MKKLLSQKGFTFVELLVVSAVIVAVVSVTGVILTSSLRGTNKINTVNAVRQNGNYAIMQISRAIKYAKGFEGVSTTGTADADFTTNCIQVVPPLPTPTPVSVQYKHIKITAFDGNKTIFSCSSFPPTISSNSASLLDTNSVSLSSCFFTCIQPGVSEMPVIGVDFVLSQLDPNALAEKRASIPFQTSIIMRNLNK